MHPAEMLGACNLAKYGVWTARRSSGRPLQIFRCRKVVGTKVIPDELGKVFNPCTIGRFDSVVPIQHEGDGEAAGEDLRWSYD